MILAFISPPRPPAPREAVNTLGSQVVRDIVLPALEKEVNEGKNFALLRQINNALILATWYKRALKESLLGKFYVDKSKTSGLEYATLTRGHVAPPRRGNVSPSRLPTNQALNAKAPQGNTSTPNDDIEYIYNRYLQAFKKGVYNYIKEEADPYTRQTVPRKYFSGGFEGKDYSMVVKTTRNTRDVPDTFRERIQRTRLNNGLMDVAMVAREFKKVDSAMTTNEKVVLSQTALDGVRQLKRWMEEAVQKVKDARADWKGRKIQINEYGQRLKQAANVREQYSSFLKDDPFLSKLRLVFTGGGMHLPKQDPNNPDEKDRYISALERDPEGGLVIGVTENSQYMTSLEVSNTFGAITYYVPIIEQDEDFFLSQIDGIIDDILSRGKNVIDLLAKFESSQPGTEFETVDVEGMTIGTDGDVKIIVISIVDPRLIVVQPDQVAGDQTTAATIFRQAVEATQAVLPETKPKLRILFVDDYPIARQTALMWFTLPGYEAYEVEVADSGEDALEKISANPKRYSVVISGWNMSPEMNGGQLISRVRAMEQERGVTRPLPFIIQTADKEVEPRALAVVDKDLGNITAVLKANEESSSILPVDAAMSAVATKTPGGIDLNPANLNLRIKRDGSTGSPQAAKGVALPVGQQDMGQLNNIEGLMPVIIEIRPATHIPALSGVLATVD